MQWKHVLQICLIIFKYHAIALVWGEDLWPGSFLYLPLWRLYASPKGQWWAKEWPGLDLAWALPHPITSISSHSKPFQAFDIQLSQSHMPAMQKQLEDASEADCSPKDLPNSSPVLPLQGWCCVHSSHMLFRRASQPRGRRPCHAFTPPLSLARRQNKRTVVKTAFHQITVAEQRNKEDCFLQGYNFTVYWVVWEEGREGPTQWTKSTSCDLAGILQSILTPTMWNSVDPTG